MTLLSIKEIIVGGKMFIYNTTLHIFDSLKGNKNYTAFYKGNSCPCKLIITALHKLVPYP